MFIMLSSCRYETPLISDAKYIKTLEKDFKQKVNAIGKQNTFPSIDADKSLSLQEQQALKFLYAYMPLGDIIDYSKDFYLQNIRQSLQTQIEMPWGKTIPEDIFRHYVLPIRVNNENLDSSRVAFYKDLKERVKNLSMYDAILEVNHWCHEHVTYQPSDARTSSPLATVRTAYGRCGEESTFTVAALRAVGIPARQVYTPRWAHTDDNHAWVEAWADGQWYYLGACEPAPVLNMGWFDAPAKRALILHTKVFGRYNGPEEIMQQNSCYAEINITSSYAPTAKLEVTIVDKNKKTVNGTKVEFGIYNYAEFYPVLTKTTSEDGRASITAGLGDMSVWVAKEGKFALKTFTVGTDREVTIILDKDIGDDFSEDFDMTPPAEEKVQREIPQTLSDATNLKIALGDSLRKNYIESFISDSKLSEFAKSINANEVEIKRFLKASRGNWKEITAFLEQASDNGNTDLALNLLSIISEKDLRDAPASVLADHLINSKYQNTELFIKYVLNPRVDFEMLSPYRSWFLTNIPNEVRLDAQNNPKTLANWANRIAIRDDLNPLSIPISPIGVYKLGVADKKSRDIFFVALCRSFGIPARLEEVSGKPQYFHGNNWQNAIFDAETVISPTAVGYVKIDYAPTKTLENPLYDSHFTIQRVANNTMKRMNFRDTEGAEATVSWRSQFQKPVALQPGYYLLISGTRQSNGKVLARVKSFSVKPNETSGVNLTMRQEAKPINVLGKINPMAEFLSLGTNSKQSIIGRNDGIYAIALIGSGQEPSNHFIRDLIRLRDDFEVWENGVRILFENNLQWQRFKADEFSGLPSNIIFGLDENLSIGKMLKQNLAEISTNDLPMVVIANQKGEVFLASQGYTIGLGNQMIRMSRGLSPKD
jgi:transglutaminase-like putative cysteine protease